MMKKNDVLTVLENGGYICLIEIYRHANVMSAAGEKLDTCRYDTAERIGSMEGYENARIGSAWNYIRHVRKIGVREEILAAAAEELRSITDPGSIQIRAKVDCYIGKRISKGTTFIITVYGNGTRTQPANAYGTLYDFDSAKHAICFEIVSRPERADDLDAQSARVETATREALARAGMLDTDPAPAQEPKRYTSEGEDTTSAAQAMTWHRAGRAVTVWGHRQDGTAYHVRITGQAQKPARDENRDHCRSIALELEQYAAGNVYRCPDCGSLVDLPEDVGDKYKCPCCGTVQETDDLEQQSLYDYFEDVYNIEYRVGSDRETVNSVQLMVACGGPNIYIDTASRAVELYWWSERASYPISYDVCNEIDDWAQEMWSCC